MCNLIEICNQVVTASNEFEKNNTELKKLYLIRNIVLYNYVASNIIGNFGTFGTGYPFYALGKNFNGELPVIGEQILYNNELLHACLKSNSSEWPCLECLQMNADSMPDLKQICKTCPNIADALKPRKIINRLPDIDMWMVCDESHITDAREQFIQLFNKYGLYSSDIDPVRTIIDVQKINEQLKNGIIPDKTLPIDAHIIGYSTMYSLIDKVPFILEQAFCDGIIPYLPIQPLSYRKTWQYDDAAYNFVHDYLSSLTDFHFESDLKRILTETREYIANKYSFDQLYDYLILTGPMSVKNRHKTKVLKDRFKERIDSWK